MQIAKLLVFQDSGLKAGPAKIIFIAKSSQVGVHVSWVLAFHTTAGWNYFSPTMLYVVSNNDFLWDVLCEYESF